MGLSFLLAFPPALFGAGGGKHGRRLKSPRPVMDIVAAPPHAATMTALPQSLRLIDYFFLRCQG
jgi:hypothetical protein